MIKFPCRCGHIFNVTDDEAGGLVQCPRCHLLMDVPALSDLRGMDDEGLYKVGEDETLKEANRLAELKRAFQKSRVDEEGEEIDLRQTIDDIRMVGDDDGVPLSDAAAVHPESPKYDPITGELIRPLEVKDDRPGPAIPMAKPALSYAARVRPGGEIDATAALGQLFTPMNLTVMFFIFLAHLFTQAVTITTMAGLFLMVPITFLMNMLIFAHYACVVDETGPEGHDELPRPLRHMEWTTDMWGPFVQFAIAGLYCYFPAGATLGLAIPTGPRLLIAGGLFLLGSFFFPAALLTTTTSGTALNLRPDRLMGTIQAIGAKYVLIALLWLVTGPLYAASVFFSLIKIAALFVPPGTFFNIGWLVSYGGLVAAIILMHYFCWVLGIMYREYQPQFPWVLQHHTRREDLAPNERLAMSNARDAVKTRRRAERQAYRPMRGRI